MTRSSWLLTIVLAVSFQSTAEARTRYTAPLQASIIIDAQTGAILQATNADGITHPASLTKMMTLYILFDQLSAGRMRLDQRMEVSEHAAAQAPSKLGLQPGESIRVEDAILALVTKSANDVAVTIAEAIGGSESQFAAQMTQRARSLGMSRTVFRNASGLPDPEQVTTARDMATLGRDLWRTHHRYYGYFATRSFDWNGDTINSHNRLMLRYHGADGIKTGYIRASGFNLVSSAERGGRRLVGVVMGGRSGALRDRHMEELLDVAFSGRVSAPEDRVEQAMAEPKPNKTPTKANAKPVIKRDAKGHQVVVLRLPTKKDEPPQKSSHASWGVQLGAYARESAARSAVEAASRHHANLLAAGHPMVVQVKAGKSTVYRARVVGISEAQARTLCRKFSGAQGCQVIQPGA